MNRMDEQRPTKRPINNEKKDAKDATKRSTVPTQKKRWPFIRKQTLERTIERFERVCCLYRLR